MNADSTIDLDKRQLSLWTYSRMLSSVEAITSLTRNRVLIRQLASREIRARFQGSLLGPFWIVLMPLLMLAIYAFVFGLVFKSKWPGSGDTQGDFAIRIFSGLAVFSFFGDVVARSPRLILENPTYVKKIAFPVECLPWVAIASAGVASLASLFVLIAGVLWVNGNLPWTSLLLPLYLAPLILFVAGCAWVLAGLGAYFRDLNNFVGFCVSALLFLTPIFYPTSAVPENFQAAIRLNPLTFYVESIRSLLIEGVIPNAVHYATSLLIAVTVFMLGSALFKRLRPGFADVL